MLSSQYTSALHLFESVSTCVRVTDLSNDGVNDPYEEWQKLAAGRDTDLCTVDCFEPFLHQCGMDDWPDDVLGTCDIKESVNICITRNAKAVYLVAWTLLVAGKMTNLITASFLGHHPKLSH